MMENPNFLKVMGMGVGERKKGDLGIISTYVKKLIRENIFPKQKFVDLNVWGENAKSIITWAYDKNVLKDVVASSMGMWHQLVFLGRALVFFNIIKKVVNVFSHESYHWLINNEHITRLIGLETPYNWLVFVVVQRSCAASRAGSSLFLWTGLPSGAVAPTVANWIFGP